MCCHGGGMVDTRDLKSLAHCGRVGSSPTRGTISGSSSVGRAQPCQGWGREFESRFPLKDNEMPGPQTGHFYFKSLTTRRVFFERSPPCFGFSPKSVQESVQGVVLGQLNSQFFFSKILPVELIFLHGKNKKCSSPKGEILSTIVCIVLYNSCLRQSVNFH